MELGIFRTLISRLAPSSRQEDERSEFHRLRLRRRWKRTLLLVPLLVGLFYAVGVERGHPANGEPGRWTACHVGRPLDPFCGAFAGRARRRSVAFDQAGFRAA